MRIGVALSGGVDSSVAFKILHGEGHDVFGVTMRHLPKEMVSERVGSCCAPSAISAAGRLAASIGAPHYVFNMEEEFAAHVMAPSAQSYARGITPNPCVWCNERVKFDLLYRRAMALGADAFATGHYARIIDGQLYRGVDAVRDQSYFLYRIASDVLAKTHFPLGGMPKTEVRERAREFGLEMSDKEDSMDICFAPKGDFTAAFERHAPAAMTSGEVIDEEGIIVGRHDGVGRVTLGQRRGLGIAGASRKYVTGIDPVDHRVFIGERPLVRKIVAADAIVAKDVPEAFEALARIRSQHKGVATRVLRGDRELSIEFDEPQSGVTPGQSVVLYDGDRVLGGGIIQLAAQTEK